MSTENKMLTPLQIIGMGFLALVCIMLVLPWFDWVAGLFFTGLVEMYGAYWSMVKEFVGAK